MYKLISFIGCTGSCLIVNAQIYLADNGLTASGSGTSKKVSIGGTLNNAATSIDFGSSNSSSNFLIKKGSSNYFFIDNNGNVSIGTNTPSYKLDVTGTGNFTSSLRSGSLSIGAAMPGTEQFYIYNSGSN